MDTNSNNDVKFQTNQSKQTRIKKWFESDNKNPATHKLQSRKIKKIEMDPFMNPTNNKV